MVLPFLKKDPSQTAKQMQASGEPPNTIFDQMNKDGYNPSQSSDAMNQMNPPPMMGQSNNSPFPMNDNPPPFIPPQNMPPPPMYQNQSFPPASQYAPMNNAVTNHEDIGEIEELIEQVIEEKWKEIERNISKIIDWKERTDSDLIQIKTQLGDLRTNFESLQKAIIGKVGDYDKNLVSVGAQLGAMEKAFSKVLPTFIENINELDRITRRMKE